MDKIYYAEADFDSASVFVDCAEVVAEGEDALVFLRPLGGRKEVCKTELGFPQPRNRRLGAYGADVNQALDVVKDELQWRRSEIDEKFHDALARLTGFWKRCGKPIGLHREVG